ncbi:hypothetical protein ACLKA7_003569 [Drosophila subpalustris]
MGLGHAPSTPTPMPVDERDFCGPQGGRQVERKLASYYGQQPAGKADSINRANRLKKKPKSSQSKRTR